MKKIQIIPQVTHDQAGDIIRTYGVIINGVPKDVITNDGNNTK